MNGTGIAPSIAPTSIEVKAVHKASVLRTTIIIPDTVDQNIELCRLKLGLSKNDVIREALKQFIRNQGLDPDRAPKSLDVSY